MDRILLIENDAATRQTVAACSAALGSALETIVEPDREFDARLREGWALLLLAAALPGTDDLALLHRIRAASRAPVVLLVPPDNEIDGILGLELGADVYLTKPLNPRALLAQMRALLRRAHPEAPGDLPPARLMLGGLELDEQFHVARYAGERLELTLSEFELMRLLAHAGGEAVSRETMSRQLLGREFSPADRSLDVHVSNLRRKLAAAAGQPGHYCIRAVRNVGYALTLR
jgi:two-component system response regulator CpxR